MLEPTAERRLRNPCSTSRTLITPSARHCPPLPLTGRQSFDHLPHCDRPATAGVQSLASKGTLHTDDEENHYPCPQRYPSRSSTSGGHTARLLGDEHFPFYVPLMTRPWVMDACHSGTSCRLGVARTVQVVEPFYWKIGIEMYAVVNPPSSAEHARISTRRVVGQLSSPRCRTGQVLTLPPTT